MNVRRGCASNRSRGKFQLTAVMSSFLKYLIAVCIFSVVAGAATEPPGFVEGHLKIVSPKEVELADGNAPAITAENYARYPLIILSQGEKKEIARVTADRNGNYRTALPPGDYVFDVQAGLAGENWRGLFVCSWSRCHVEQGATSRTIYSGPTGKIRDSSHRSE